MNEKEPLYLTLESLFKEVSRNASLVDGISLFSLANQLSEIVREEDLSLKDFSHIFYWFSFLLYSKAEWLFETSSHKAKKSLSKNKISLKAKSVFPLKREVESLVLYLEHKTFKSLALNRKSSYSKVSPLREDQLKEIYNNLRREKERKEDLSHIYIQESTFSNFLSQWESLLSIWKESVSFNEIVSPFNRQEKTLAFMDILQKQKNGNLEVFQSGVNKEIFLGKVKKEGLKSYG